MNSNKKKDLQLGMAHGTAANRLRKKLLFKYVTMCGDNTCFRCGKSIDSIDNFSIDHKIAWLNCEICYSAKVAQNSVGHKKVRKVS